MTRSTKIAIATPVVLKDLHRDILKANPNLTLTTKKMRVILRQKMNDVHAKNSSWVFNATDYDRARVLFDATYAKKIAKPVRAPRAKKVKVSETPDAQ